MPTKRRRPTREELDERLRIALGKIPASIEEAHASEPAAARTGTGEWRIVSGTIKGSGAAAD